MREDRVAAYFHMEETTHAKGAYTYSGMVYNGWLGDTLLFSEEDAVICPLLFHVSAVHDFDGHGVLWGAVFPNAGYYRDGVFDNFWKLIERWGITFVITVPTAISP